MPQRIQEDWYEFRRIIYGKVREELQKRISSGSLFRQRGNGKSIRVTIPQIHLPYIGWGKPEDGVGRGQGKPGDVIKPGKDKGQGNKPGTDPGDGIMVDVDLDEVMKLLKDELQLPDLKPKPNQTYEEVRVVYNGLSKVGPMSLLHKKRTMAACMKRLAAQGKLHEKVWLPNLSQPVSILAPINDDRRFRQYNEIKIPSSNAVIFFMRDGSGSMDKTKCDIASDIAYWLDLYVRAFYKRTERVFIWHDTEAREMSEQDFFGLRYGGGTYCSSALKLMRKIIKNRYNPVKWNIYGIYFGDGESAQNDNQEFVKLLKKDLGPNVVNMFGQVEILNWGGFGFDSLKTYIDKHMGKDGMAHVRNCEIARPKDATWNEVWKDEEVRDKEIRRVLKVLLGKSQQDRKDAAEATKVMLEEVV